MKSLPYYDDLTARQTIKLRELIKTLPPFAKEFFRAIDSTTQVRTRIAYAYDLRVFQNGTDGFHIGPSGSDYGNRSGRIYGIFKGLHFGRTT